MTGYSETMEQKCSIVGSAIEMKNNNINGGNITMKTLNGELTLNNNQEVVEMNTNNNNIMEGLVNVAVVSRKECAVVFYDIEGEEGFYKSGSIYDGSVELGYMVMVHNFLQKLNMNGKKGLTVNIQLTNRAQHLLSGRRVDKLDKLDNWVNLDTRKQANWKAVSRELAKQIRLVQQNGGVVAFTSGTNERTFKRAWGELNKISPKMTY